MKVNMMESRSSRSIGRPRFSQEQMRDHFSNELEEDDYSGRTSRERNSVILQRDEALKREEALRDRLKLQEAINQKQMQELRAQTKRLSAENLKLQRTSMFGSSYKTDKKKDGKSREVRELNKNVEQLKLEKQSLQQKLDGLSEFIRVAGELKNEAVSQCREKNEIIRRLREEKELAQQMRNEETRRRFQVEGELHSLQLYVEYTERKTREKCRSKSVQTDTSIPLRMGLAGQRSSTSIGNPPRRSSSLLGRPSLRSSHIGNTTDGGASYSALTSAAALWKLRSVESGFQKDSMAMKKKICQATQDYPGKNTKADVNSSNLHGRHSYPPTNTETQNRTRFANYVDVKRSNMQSNVNQSNQQSKSLILPPPPPPPQRPPLGNGNSSRQKYTQHTATMAPAAMVYNSRIEM